MQVTVLAGGVGGSRFLRGVRALLLDRTERDAGDADDLASERAGEQASERAGNRANDGPGHTARDRADEGAGEVSPLTAVVNTADDITLFGLRVSPDLDTVMYTLGGGSDEERGWGRSDETFRARDELVAYGVQPQWFGLGDRDLATHLVRTQMLGAGFSLSEVTAALCERWRPGLRLLPMTDARVETHVVVDDTDAPGGRRAMHFQEYWVRWHARPTAREVVVVGIEEATPAPGVLDAIRDAEVVLLAPSNPVVSIGPILAVAGVRDALRSRAGPVVGVSPIIAGAPVRGMADKLLAAIGVASDAGAVARHYGARDRSGVLDGWLVDSSDADAVDAVRAAGIECRAVPLLMSDETASAAIARDALALAGVDYP